MLMEWGRGHGFHTSCDDVGIASLICWGPGNGTPEHRKFIQCRKRELPENTDGGHKPGVFYGQTWSTAA